MKGFKLIFLGIFLVLSCNSTKNERLTSNSEDCYVPRIDWLEITTKSSEVRDGELAPLFVQLLQSDMKNIQDIFSNKNEDIEFSLQKIKKGTEVSSLSVTKTAKVSQAFYQKSIAYRNFLCTLIALMKSDLIKKESNKQILEDSLTKYVSNMSSYLSYYNDIETKQIKKQKQEDDKRRIEEEGKRRIEEEKRRIEEEKEKKEGEERKAALKLLEEERAKKTQERKSQEEAQRKIALQKQKQNERIENEILNQKGEELVFENGVLQEFSSKLGIIIHVGDRGKEGVKILYPNRTTDYIYIMHGEEKRFEDNRYVWTIKYLKPISYGKIKIRLKTVAK